MLINTNTIVPMTEANQNFSKVAHIVDENGMAIIMKNNKPKFIVMNFDEYDDIEKLRDARKNKVNSTADKIIEDNMEVFLELAK